MLLCANPQNCIAEGETCMWRRRGEAYMGLPTCPAQNPHPQQVTKDRVAPLFSTLLASWPLPSGVVALWPHEECHPSINPYTFGRSTNFGRSSATPRNVKCAGAAEEIQRGVCLTPRPEKAAWLKTC